MPLCLVLPDTLIVYKVFGSIYGQPEHRRQPRRADRLRRQRRRHGEAAVGDDRPADGRVPAAEPERGGLRGEEEREREGPVITVFEFQPAPGVKVSHIVNLQDDLVEEQELAARRMRPRPRPRGSRCRRAAHVRPRDRGPPRRQRAGAKGWKCLSWKQ